MKTAEERAKEFCGGLSLPMGEAGALLGGIIYLIKEQDRDTRHACAEATIKLARAVSQCSTVDFCKGFNNAIVLAHDACVNVKAV